VKTILAAACAVLAVVLTQEVWAEAVAFAQEPDTKPNTEAPKPDSDGPKPLSFSDYDVLIKRNIFSHDQPRARIERERHRGIYDPRTGTYSEDFVGPPLPKDYVAPGISNVESDIVLIGAVQRDGVGTATLEDRRAGKILLVRCGDKIARGTVSKITVDGLEYVVGDKTLTIGLGSNLEGGTSLAKPVENGATAPASGGSENAGSTGSAGGDMGSILEQMKRKRLKELGQ
jgi:hypothetical protein